MCVIFSRKLQLTDGKSPNNFPKAPSVFVSVSGLKWEQCYGAEAGFSWTYE